MLPFLADPRQFTRGVLAEREQNVLSALSWTHHRRLRAGLFVISFFALLMALLPLINYMGANSIYHGFAGHPGLFLPLMAGMTYLVHCLVMLLTFNTAWLSVRAAEPGDGGADTRQLIITRWWAVIRHMWLWQVLAGLLKLGLALGLAQFFFTNWGSATCSSTLWYAWSLCYYNQQAASRAMLNPSGIQIVLAAAALAAFALLETGLQAALGLRAALAFRSKRQFAIGGAVAARLALIAVIAFVWLFCARYNDISQGLVSVLWADDPEFHPATVVHDTKQIAATGQIAFSVVGDGGASLAADLMRPAVPSIHLWRRLVSALWGITIYAVLICLALRLVLRRAVRRSAPQPGEAVSAVPGK